MRVGYACVNTRLPSPARTTRLANATPDRLRELTAANLDALDAILRWNAERGLDVFRLTSNLVPFASHPVNRLRWWDEHADRLAALGALARRHGMRLSTHPGPYTVVASASRAVAAAARAELAYHARLLTALGLDGSHKIVVHLTGGPARFAAAYRRLPAGVRERLVVENDERWALGDVLPLAERLGAPVVFDAFHHSLRPSLDGLDTRALVRLVSATWSPSDGRPEVHFSTQAPGRRPGAHAETLDERAFRRFARDVGDLPLDCILEVKDKERSALRAAAVLSGRVQGQSLDVSRSVS